METEMALNSHIFLCVQHWIGLSSDCSILCPRKHSIGYIGDGFYRSKDPTNSIKVLKEQIVHKQIKHTISRHEHKTASPLVYNNMGWLGDGSRRGQGCQAWTAVGLPPRYPPVSSRCLLVISHVMTLLSHFYSVFGQLLLARYNTLCNK